MIGERQALRVSEAAELLGVARSTAHRLLSALRRRGFVMQDRPNGAYRPGPALNAVGMAAMSSIEIRQFVRPVLEELRDDTSESTSLAILEGTWVRFVDGAESMRSVRVGNRTGIIKPAHATAIGKAILAAIPLQELERHYPFEQLPKGGTPRALATRQGLLAALEEVRAAGYACNWEESSEGVSAIGVVLRDYLGTPIAALAIAAPTSRMGSLTAVHAFAPLALAAAEKVCERLAASR